MGSRSGRPRDAENFAAQLKMFLDEAGELSEQSKLINKVVTAFTTSQTVHGGQESTIHALNNTFYHWGAIGVPLGYTISEAGTAAGTPMARVRGGFSAQGPQTSTIGRDDRANRSSD